MESDTPGVVKPESSSSSGGDSPPRIKRSPSDGGSPSRILRDIPAFIKKSPSSSNNISRATSPVKSESDESDLPDFSTVCTQSVEELDAENIRQLYIPN
jgi:hypothetical protein